MPANRDLRVAELLAVRESQFPEIVADDHRAFRATFVDGRQPAEPRMSAEEFEESRRRERVRPACDGLARVEVVERHPDATDALDALDRLEPFDEFLGRRPDLGAAEDVHFEQLV